ncbi:MAG: FHA domain-containing protein, partial [Myxococcota bacterium]
MTDATFRPTGTQVQHARGRVALVAHRLRILVVSGPDSGKSFDIAAPRAIVGHSPTCDIVVRDPEISRKHCAIEVRDGVYRVRDLDSTNGTFLQGIRVADAEVPSGGRLRLGSSELVFTPKKKFVRLDPSSVNTFGELVGTSQAMLRVRWAHLGP